MATIKIRNRFNHDFKKGMSVIG